jgi:hypothetical protein
VLVTRLAGAVLALALVAGSAAAQTPGPQSLPLRGFVPSYEILHTIRAAGFEPLGPPLRQGTIYVVRAIDVRGVAIRVVLDARSGALREVNRIVSGYGVYGPYAPGPYAPGPYALGPYSPGRYAPAYYGRPPSALYRPASDELAVYGRGPHIGASESSLGDQDEPRGLLGPPRSTATGIVPLPRPRPAALVITGTATVKLPAKPDISASAPVPATSGESSNAAGAFPLPAIND